jgi:hypothetical protein
MNNPASNLTRLTLPQVYRQQLEACERTSQEQYRQLVEQYRDALKHDEKDPTLYIRLAESHNKFREQGAVFNVLREGIDRRAPSLNSIVPTSIHLRQTTELRKLS